ncbi:hypothetical protein Tco_0415857 [Tanacetum coccineum]
MAANTTAVVLPHQGRGYFNPNKRINAIESPWLVKYSKIIPPSFTFVLAACRQFEDGLIWKSCNWEGVLFLQVFWLLMLSRFRCRLTLFHWLLTRKLRSNPIKLRWFQELDMQKRRHNPETVVGINEQLACRRSFARMEQVIISAPDQECLVMETDKDEVSAKLTTVDENSSIPITTSKKRKRNQRAKKTAMVNVLSAKVNEVVSVEMVLVSGETVPDKSVTDKTTPEKKKMEVAGNVLSTQVHGEVSGETVLGKTRTINTTRKKKKRNKKKTKLKTVAGNILSTCENVQGKGNAIKGLSAIDITESISGEMVSGKTAFPDVKMVSQEEHTEAVNGKMGSSATPNLKVNGAVNSSLTIGEILTPQNLQNLKVDSGETGSGTNAADTTASKKRKRGKNKKKSPLSGDILSTCENIQDKVNAIDDLRTTNVLDTKFTNKTKLSDITNHKVAGKKGPEVVNSEIGASNATSKQQTKKQKVGATTTLGEKLIIFYVNGLLADTVFPRPKDVEADKYYHGKAGMMFGYGCCNFLLKGRAVKTNIYGIDGLLQMQTVYWVFGSVHHIKQNLFHYLQQERMPIFKRHCQRWMLLGEFGPAEKLQIWGGFGQSWRQRNVTFEDGEKQYQVLDDDGEVSEHIRLKLWMFGSLDDRYCEAGMDLKIFN